MATLPAACLLGEGAEAATAVTPAHKVDIRGNILASNRPQAAVGIVMLGNKVREAVNRLRSISRLHEPPSLQLVA